MRGQIYHPGILDQSDIGNAIRECYQRADLLSAPKAGGTGQSLADYRYGDPAYEKFSEIVPRAMMRDPAGFVSRGATALARCADEDGDHFWTSADRVMPKDFDSCLEEKLHGPGRDLRVLPVQRDVQDVRIRPLREAISEFTFDDTKARAADWPFGGPSATR